MDVVAAILGQGRSSRFYRALIQEQGVALEAYAYQMSQVLSSVFMVQAKPTEGHTIEEVEATISGDPALVARAESRPCLRERWRRPRARPTRTRVAAAPALSGLRGRDDWRWVKLSPWIP